LPFLPFFDCVVDAGWERSLNPSRVAEMGNLTFGVVGGKSGKKRQGDVAALASKWQRWQRRGNTGKEHMGKDLHPNHNPAIVEV
jgi:hypothetical protein